MLDRAWLEAAGRHHFEQWPDCAEILKAAERLHALAHPKAKPDDSWVEKAMALTEAYTCRYMLTTRVGVRSREAGYEAELKSYVREASWVQSQMILGGKDVGYVSSVLFPGREGDKEAEGRFFEKCRAQGELGNIRVHVPAELIDAWKGQAREMGRPR